MTIYQVIPILAVRRSISYLGKDVSQRKSAFKTFRCQL